MIFQATDPRTSRGRFKGRIVENIAALTLGFVTCVSFTSFAISGLGGGLGTMMLFDAILLAATYYFYILLNDRPIAIRCDSCRKVILSNSPWVCGVCGRENRNGNEYSFLGRCCQCQNEPKAYKCHHCGEVIYFSEDANPHNCARSINTPEKEEPVEAHEKKIKKKENQIQSTQTDIELTKAKITKAELDRRLAFIKKASDKKSDRVKNSLDQHLQDRISVEEVAQETKAKNAERFKDNPKMRRRADAAVDEWQRNIALGNE